MEETGKVESQELNRCKKKKERSEVQMWISLREDPNQMCFKSVFLLEMCVGKTLIRDVRAALCL